MTSFCNIVSDHNILLKHQSHNLFTRQTSLVLDLSINHSMSRRRKSHLNYLTSMMKRKSWNHRKSRSQRQREGLGKTLQTLPHLSSGRASALLPDPQTELLQQLLVEVRNQGRLIKCCMLSGQSSRSRSLPFPCPDNLGPQLVASPAQPAAMPPQATTSDHRPFPPPPQQQLSFPPPVSRAPSIQPLTQSWQPTNPPDHSQFPATSQVSVSRNPLLPAYTLPPQTVPAAMARSAQSVYQSRNVQPHHLTSVALLGHLAPPSGRLQSYRKVEGPSFPYLTSEDESQYMIKMALSNLLDPGESEQYKYHILLDHLKVDQVRRLALAYVHAQDPYTQAIRALDERYGQPRQLALRELRAIMEMPAIRIGDGRGLDQFSLRVQALVGLPQSMGHEGLSELTCGSHVERLLEKLPSEQFCQFKRSMSLSRPGPLSYNLLDFSSWLRHEARCQPRRERTLQPVRPKQPPSHPFRATAILHGSKTSSQVNSPKVQIAPPKASPLPPPTPYPNAVQSVLTVTPLNIMSVNVRTSSTSQKIRELVGSKSRNAAGDVLDHFATQCDLKGRCNQCNGKHLQVLCNNNQRQVQNFYLDHPSD
ncbi:hypothetical protein AALO_G00045080 [Alosa alosa]|uniref:Uncharacterized protein n=1 Tax=Alosa alosa TaxID=278164 RepID=A0AAV6HDY8_9TELE|nr:hypothetical protein AALO_G00045080 [Alosa alosa]